MALRSSAENQTNKFSTRPLRRAHDNRKWAQRISDFHWRCYYCGNALRMRFEDCHLEPEHELTKDHLIPLCRGGEDTIENLVPACLRCNMMKAGRTAQEFIASRPAFQHFQSKNSQRSTGISLDKPSGGFALELRDNPALLEELRREEAKVSWAWRHPA